MIEKLVDLFAPARCIGCSFPGSPLCRDCRQLAFFPVSRCYRCHRPTQQFQVCPSCRKSVALKHVWVVSDFSGSTRDLIYALKFERLACVSEVVASEMASILPLLPADTIICHVPTSTVRVRIRGYDQALLIAKELSNLTDLNRKTLLRKISNTRQLGASRPDRFKQAKTSYQVIDQKKIANKNILLVDDVTTSGATLEVVAQLLKKSGAKTVDAIVCAQAID